MGILWETSFWIFFFLTVVLGGGAAALSGRALALNWRPWWHAVLYMIPLTAAVRFFHYALFDELAGTLLSLHYFVVDLAVILAAALASFRLTRARQLVRQYPWLYERTGMLTMPRQRSDEASPSASE